jgi:hypothetical protein
VRRILAPLADRFLWNLSNHIMRRRYDRACIEAQQALTRVLPRAAATLAAQRSEGGLSHQFSELKLLELAKVLWQFRPKTILELGGGGTTAVLAEYAAAFPDVRVISVDENLHYLNVTRQRLASELQERITFVHCARQEAVDSDGVRTCYYDDVWQKLIPEQNIDLVYVDGPTADDGEGGKLPCVDTVRLIDAGWKIGHVLFDVRIASVRYCMDSGRFAGHVLHPHRNALNLKLETWVVDKVKHHSWFEPGPLTQIDPKSFS